MNTPNWIYHLMKIVQWNVSLCKRFHIAAVLHGSYNPRRYFLSSQPNHTHTCMHFEDCAFKKRRSQNIKVYKHKYKEHLKTVHQLLHTESKVIFTYIYKLAEYRKVDDSWWQQHLIWCPFPYKYTKLFDRCLGILWFRK